MRVYMVTTIGADRVHYAVYTDGGDGPGGRGACRWEADVRFGRRPRRRAGGAAFVAAAREQAAQAEACARRWAAADAQELTGGEG